MTALLLVFLVVLVALNGLFVAAEIGLVRSRRAKLEVMANDGEKGAARALAQIDGMTEYIAACQVGITLCSIGIGFLGEPSLAKLLEPVFGGFSDALAATLAVAIAFCFVTAIHITFGELTPKLAAIPNAESVAKRLSRPLGLFRTVSAPITGGLTAVATWAVRVFGVRPGSLEESHSAEDIKVIISQSQTGGVLDPGEAGMLSGVFHLQDRKSTRLNSSH